MTTFDEALSDLTLAWGKPHVEERYNNGYTARARWNLDPGHPWANITLWEDRWPTLKGEETSVYIECYRNSLMGQWNLHGRSSENPNGPEVPLVQAAHEAREWLEGRMTEQPSFDEDPEISEA